MLATTLSTHFIPGTNLKSQVVGANWLFLLPDLGLEKSIYLGTPKLSSLRTLSRLSREVYICNARTGALKDINLLNFKNVYTLSLDSMLQKLKSATTDLLILSDQSIIHRFFRDQSFQVDLRNLLKPEGHLYFESHEIDHNRYETQPLQQFGKQRKFWLTPSSGEMYTAVPAEDSLTSRYLLRHGLDHPSIHLRGFSKLEKSLNRYIASTKIIRHYGTLVSRDTRLEETGPPLYLQQIAENAGHSIDNYRWFSTAGEGFSTRKLLFYFFKPDGNIPAFIIKMVRDPALNYRLENEQRALTQLQKSTLDAASLLPQIIFGGYHQNLAIIGESFIEGVPFKKASRGSANCEYAISAVKFLTDLAKDTSNTMEVTPKDVSEVLRKLFEQFTKIYQLSAQYENFLDDQISILGRSQASFPLVFQHGDPGIWNAISNSSHQTVFLDWEAAESKGLPLWDLFYFLRSYTVLAARNHGTRDALQGIKRLLLEETTMSRFWVEVTRQYCQRINLSEELVEPLFYTCWIHRALKESTRLTPSKLNRGSYITLLKFFIDQHSSSFLSNLFLLSTSPLHNIFVDEGIEETL